MPAPGIIGAGFVDSGAARAVNRGTMLAAGSAMTEPPPARGSVKRGAMFAAGSAASRAPELAERSRREARV